MAQFMLYSTSLLKTNPRVKGLNCDYYYKSNVIHESQRIVTRAANCRLLSDLKRSVKARD